MNSEDINRLSEAAQAISEIVRKNREEAAEIEKALEPLRDLVPARVIEKEVTKPGNPYPWNQRPRQGPWHGIHPPDREQQTTFKVTDPLGEV